MSVTREVSGVTVSLVRGDICDREVDAIVNAANDHLWMGGGVAGAIKRRGGLEVELEAMAQGPIAVGAAVATTAGALNAKHVIHAAVMGQDLSTNAEKIRKATAGALDLAKQMQLTRVAFPALGTGVGGFPPGECARTMLAAVTAHAASDTTLTAVEFVLFDQVSYDAFARALAEVSDGG